MTHEYQQTVRALGEIHRTDPSHPSSLEYHESLVQFTRLLSSTCPIDALHSPSEALLLAANAQHVARWKRPRSDYPLGLTGYKLWRTALNKFHADLLHETMLESGYSAERDAALFTRTRDLLLKRTLQRPPLPKDLGLLRDPEAHLFEDAICLTFLARDFAAFAAEYHAPPPAPSSAASASTVPPGTDAPGAESHPPLRAGGTDKLKTIVSRTWAKMTSQGRQVAVEQLVGTLDEDLRNVVVEAVGACEKQEEELRASAGASAAGTETKAE